MRMCVKGLLPVALLGLALACGGAGGPSNESTAAGVPSFVYTAPAPNAGQPVIQINNGMTGNGVVVFDVVGTAPSQQARGVDINLAVDATKLIPVAVPGSASASLRVSGTGVDTGGFGGGQAVAVRTDRGDGTGRMVVAVRNPAPAASSQAVLMRFAYKVNGSPVAGVVRMEVSPGSGMLDARGRVIPGTAPAMGRLELKY